MQVQWIPEDWSDDFEDDGSAGVEIKRYCSRARRSSRRCVEEFEACPTKAEIPDFYGTFGGICGAQDGVDLDGQASVGAKVVPRAHRWRFYGVMSAGRITVVRSCGPFACRPAGLEK